MEDTDQEGEDGSEHQESHGMLVFPSRPVGDLSTMVMDLLRDQTQ